MKITREQQIALLKLAIKAVEFLKWYVKSLHASRDKTAQHLHEMEDRDVVLLTRLANDLTDDLARHRKRKLCAEQLNESEQLMNW